MVKFLTQKKYVRDSNRRLASSRPAAAGRSAFAVAAEGIVSVAGPFSEGICVLGARPVPAMAKPDQLDDWYHAGQPHTSGSIPHDQRTHYAAIPAILPSEQSR